MFRFLIFDLDETLYPRNAGLMQEIGVRINRYLIENLHLPQDQANELRKRYYNQHGTALRGLVVERPDVDPGITCVSCMTFAWPITSGPIRRWARCSVRSR